MDNQSAVPEIQTSSLTRTVITWNIQHGGGTKERCRSVILELNILNTDVFVLTEFRNNAAGYAIKTRLTELGYFLSHPEVPERANTVLVASRQPIDRGYALDQGLADQRHLWVVELGWIKLCAVYMPLGKAKVPYWKALHDAALEECGPEIFIGDFNTGNNQLDLSVGASPFIASEHFDAFGRGRLKDIWRTRNPDLRDYTWYSTRGKNGFRLDHVFATAEMSDRIASVRYIHEIRTRGLSDHSALLVELSAPAGTTGDHNYKKS